MNNVSVYVRRTDEGVAVDLYPKGDEMEDAICGTWCLFSEAETPDEMYGRRATEKLDACTKKIIKQPPLGQK